MEPTSPECRWKLIQQCLSILVICFKFSSVLMMWMVCTCMDDYSTTPCVNIEFYMLQSNYPGCYAFDFELSAVYFSHLEITD